MNDDDDDDDDGDDEDDDAYDDADDFDDDDDGDGDDDISPCFIIRNYQKHHNDDCRDQHDHDHVNIASMVSNLWCGKWLIDK